MPLLPLQIIIVQCVLIFLVVFGTLVVIPFAYVQCYYTMIILHYPFPLLLLVFRALAQTYLQQESLILSMHPELINVVSNSLLWTIHLWRFHNNSGCTATRLILFLAIQVDLLAVSLRTCSCWECFWSLRCCADRTVNSLSSPSHFIIIRIPGVFLPNSLYMPCLYKFLLYIPEWLVQWPCFLQHKKYQDEQCVQTL